MRKKYWLFYIIIIISLGLTNVFGGKVNAETATIIDLNQQSPFKGRTYEDMVEHYSDALMAGETYNNSSSASYYKVPASTKNPYAQGTLSDDTLLNMQEMTNFMRWLTGSNPLKEKCVNSDVLQAGALVRNFEFNHAISDSSKPEDMDDDLWNYGKNASHNILAWNYTPGGAITGWMNEGYKLAKGSWDTFGHQTCLISPTYSNVQFGYAGNIAIGKKVASSNTRLSKFTAFPAPGYNPRDIVTPGVTGWSMYYDTASYTGTAANVSVTVKNVTKGTTSSRSKADNSMTFSDGEIHFIQPDDYTGSYYSDTYQIQIDGLIDKSTSKAVTIKYTVIFSDVSLDVDQVVSSVSFDFNKLYVYTTMMDEESLKKASVVLSDKVTVKGLKGATCTVPVKGAWKLDMENGYFYNSVDKSLLPDNIIDRFGKLDKITISFTEVTGGYSYGSLSFSPSNVIDGDPLKICVYRYMSSANKARVFRVISNDDGSYSGKKWMDSETHDDIEETGVKLYFKTTADVKDNGEYVAIYYYQYGAYLVSSFKQLEVKNRLITSINISETEKTVDEGDGFQLTTDILPVNATVKTLTWSSDNESVATVDKKGNVTTHSPGKAIITVSTNDGSGLSEACEVKVISPDVDLENPDIYPEIKTDTSTKKDEKIESESFPATGTQNVPVQSNTVTTTTVVSHASGTSLDEGVTVNTAEQLITICNSDEGPAGTIYGELQTSMKKSSKNSITIKWKKLSGTYYIVYGSECGSNKYQKLASVIGTSFTHRNLKKGRYYKYIVLAVHGDEVVSASKAVHIATKGGKAGNTKSIKLNNKKVGLKVGKTFKIKAKQKTVTKNTVVKKHRALSYESSDEDVATVSSKGVIKAVGKGVTYIYVYAQDGVVAKIKVVVK